MAIKAFSGDIVVVPDENLEKARILGNHIEESIENNNPSFINTIFNLDKFLEKAVPAPKNELESAFYEGFTGEFQKSFDLGISITNEIGIDGKYTFLNAYGMNGNYYLIFRMLSQQTVNYHEYRLEMVDQEFSIIDIYNYYTGSDMSDILGRVYHGGILYITAKNPVETQELKSIVKLNHISELVSSGKYSKAMKQWNKIPVSIRNEKIYLSEGLKIAKFLDEESFEEMYNLYCTNFPDEGGKYLIALEALSYQHKIQEAMACVEKLDVYLHSDPMLNLIRANLHYELGDKVASIECLKKLLSTNPDYELGYISLLGIYLEEKKYVDATLLLDQIVYIFNSYKEDLQPILVEYPEFLDSAEYTDWYKE